jgi:hypothetical protein
MATVDRIMGLESGGDPYARNPNSSATGAGQFLAGTWLNTLARHRPDLQGTKEELLALRNDLALSKEMTAAYAADNAAVLSRAGVDPTPGNTYLAHFAGPQGAVSILKADPKAPVASILGQGAVQANPFLQKMTASDLQNWATRKIMGQSQAPVAVLEKPALQGAPAAPAPQQPAQPIAPAQQAQPVMPSQPFSFTSIPGAPPPVFAPAALPIDIADLLRASGNRGKFFGAKS